MGQIEDLGYDLDKMTYEELKELANAFEGSAQRIYCYLVDHCADISKRG